jgi:hypothetical protein
MRTEHGTMVLPAGGMLLLIVGLAGVAEAADKPIPIYEGLGTYHRTIRTGSETAQAYFDQGMMLGYAFGRPEAVEARFLDAWDRADIVLSSS